MITYGNIYIIQIDDIEPSMAIIPKLDFKTCKVRDIYIKIKNLHNYSQNKFPNCNLSNYSLSFENKYVLNKKQNITLSNWFQKHNIPKDENNNYIFYINSSKKQKNSESKKKLSKQKSNNKSKKDI
jgi:hypothetical protein